MDKFANEPANTQKETFSEAAGRMGVSPIIIEKDFWVCWALKRLFSLPDIGVGLIFKGGTSLSKGYNAISRFSEDVDISLDRQNLGFVDERDPANPKLSKTKRNKLLKELQIKAEQFINGDLLNKLNDEMSSTLSRDFTLKPDPNDGQTLLFEYPEGLGGSAYGTGYVRPQVKLEFGARGAHLPAVNKNIVPYVDTEIPELIDEPTVSVNVLGAERTFWEKATILHMLYHQDSEKPLADRMSRHYYDLAQLANSETRKVALDDVALLADVAEHKTKFFQAAWAQYGDAKPGSLRLLPHEELEKTLRHDYTSMNEMIMGTVPSFDEILAAIKSLEEEINSQQ